MKRKKNKPRMLHASCFTFHDAGFTLIELLISVAIIAVISSVIFANVGSRKTDLARAARALILDVRYAQNLSLAPSAIPICIYGLRVQSATQYFLYQRPDCSDGQYRYVAGFSVQVGNTITLEDGILISSGAGQDVAFEAPEPITYVNGLQNQSLVITLTSSDGQTKNVSINRFGRVEIQ
ncbi:prepilin-type N-terminal cleavage/methylation domain-containing protein [Candidatus Azambacteria bacterium]|nr:prepilin-type N-terminal cleavage/methylation domain-containing protein [Candidatus Azambacteria bacterium]MBI3685363.1 prepilin-type N-terminal cleavage/methylation domain-containing protein [Candidatus Azambacteria bacterium]